MSQGKPKYQRIIVIATMCVILFWALTFLLFFQEEKLRGTFGDMFGAVNALFSGLAFAGIILTIYMQHEELALQRKELEETRGVFEKQSRIMADQQNDSAFFHLLANHRQMVESLKTSKSRPVFKGRNQFNVLREVVSGYEVLEEVADKWDDVFSTYSEMYQSKIIWDNTYCNIDPCSMVLKDTNMMSLVSEILHISNFVNTRFEMGVIQDFYHATFNNSLLDAEKFIVQSSYALQDDLIEVAPFGMDIYASGNYIDFKKIDLPTIEIKQTFARNDSEIDYLEVKTNGDLIGYYCIIRHDYTSDSYEVEQFKYESLLKEVTITVLEFFRSSPLEINEMPVEGEKLVRLSLRGYYLVLSILFNGDVYYVPLQLFFNSKEFIWAEPRDRHMITFNHSMNSMQISKDEAYHLVSKIEQYASLK